MTLLKTAFYKVLEGDDSNLTKEEIKVLDAHLSDNSDTIRTTADFITYISNEKEKYLKNNLPGYVEQYNDDMSALSIGML